jgi:hypothetical protein
MRPLMLLLRRLLTAAVLAGAANICVAGGETPARDLAFASNLQTLAGMSPGDTPLYEPPQLQLQHPDPAVQMLIFLNRVADKAERAERAERGLPTPDAVAIAQATIGQRAAVDASRMLRLALTPPAATGDMPSSAGNTPDFAVDPDDWRSSAAAMGGGGGSADGLASRGSGSGVAVNAAPANNAPPMFYEQQAPMPDLSRPLQRIGPLPLLMVAAALVLLGWIGWRAAG